ncbi:hypothetical protein V8F33_005797, partial [Rhypophila sp. PSN 637]
RPQIFSKDPRDRIYALLGLASDMNELGISPDYGLSVDVVYTQAARAMMVSGQGSISLLETVNFPKTVIMPDGHSDNGVPQRIASWVPDFWHHGESISLPWAEKGGIARLYTPIKPLPSDPQGTPLHTSRLLPTTDNKVFGVQGIIVDEIVCTGEVWQGNGDATLDSNTFDVTLVNSYFQEVDALCRLSSPEEKVQKDMEYVNDSWAMRIMLGDVIEPNSRPRRFGREDVPPMHQLLEVASVLKSLRQATNEGNERAREHLLDKVRAIDRKRVTPASSLFTSRLDVMTAKRPFRKNLNGYVGMGPHLAQPGDVVVLLCGARMPYMLRPAPDHGVGYYQFLGEAYCHGIMDGEASHLPVTDIYLV